MFSWTQVALRLPPDKTTPRLGTRTPNANNGLCCLLWLALGYSLTSSPPPALAHSLRDTGPSAVPSTGETHTCHRAFALKEHPSSEDLCGLLPHFLYDSAQMSYFSWGLLWSPFTLIYFLHCTYLPWHIQWFMVCALPLAYKHPLSRNLALPGPTSMLGTQ